MLKFSVNLSKRVALSALIVFCVGFLPLMLTATAELESKLTQLLSNQQSASTLFVASDIEQKILLRIQSLQDVANHLPVEKINDGAALKDYLSNRIAIYRLYSGGVFVIGLDGKGIADYPVVAGRQDGDFSSLEYFREVVSTGASAIGKPRVGRFSNELGLAVAVPVKNSQGDLVAVMVGIINLSDATVFDHAKAQIGKTGKYLITSAKEGVVFIDPANMHHMQPISEIFPEESIRSLRGDDTRVLPVKNHEKYLVSTKYILDGRWFVLGMISVDEVFQPVNALKYELYLVSLFSLIIIAVLMWWMMHRYLSPLVKAAKQLKSMVFESVPLHALTVERNDEIGDLFQSFNKLQQELKLSHEALAAQAREDFLTGLPNRRHFMELAEAELLRSERYERPLSVLMMDIDHFKNINDTYGHQAGDVVLRHLSVILRETLRQVDIIGRIGGEEFSILLPETALDSAVKVAERLREKISLYQVFLAGGLPLHFTVSVGVAALSSRDMNLDTLLNFADEALYEAKRERNKVCVAKGATDLLRSYEE